MAIPDIEYRLKQDFYRDDHNYVVFTEKFLKGRGSCCGSGCRHCPYNPRSTKGIRELQTEFTD